MKIISQQVIKITKDENEIQKDMLKESEIPKILESKVSQKGTGIIEAYGANTHQGLVRDYNEDRVSIILNIVRPPNKTHIKDWPACSFFAVYDGHGGAACADFLRDNLHQFIVKDEMFPQDPVQSIKNGFAKAEKFCLEKAEYTGMMDKSGSCAIVAFLIENKCYIANVGDSRAILSSQLGKKVNDLSTDHKPSIESEQQRIKSLGGRIYQTEIPLPSYMIQPGKPNTIKGPHRVHPGRLAVSRTFGDPESKLPRYGGIPGVISSEPEIFQFDINEQQDDFILLGCDGIFDTLDSEQTIKIIWEQKQKIIQQIQKTQQLSPYLKRKQMNNQENNNKFLNQFVGLSINHLLKTCLLRKSFDNVTVLLIAFPNLAKFFSLQNSTHLD
ncbi:Protein phosphatase 2C (PP2C)-like domain [Pseudocohnilembus persalinus]|uniref:protein-serine/threonine phosphatase n=1 Tax=Pseudocohnilembus persalinus TaxID=266149 RepID=A0A0V0QQF1_PSEPJ|nr:Protein phosphatase 2C (PP2C)-like domain [Pseudocohnilembus persalinus]|eukprot:KRX04470.1 Protein phosphatase 2C (PP2C)-like domain [Pseudocohnilembus persalinus]